MRVIDRVAVDLESWPSVHADFEVAAQRHGNDSSWFSDDRQIP